jgi:hypothetical protein
MVLKNLDRFGEEKIQAIQEQAVAFRDRVQITGGDALKSPQESLL